MPTPAPDVADVLTEIEHGNPRAADALIPDLYDALHELAGRYLRRERPDHTLQTTALVHEAYIRLSDQRGGDDDRARFLAVAATMMRRILVDHEKRRRALRRGGNGRRVADEPDAALATEEGTVDLVALDDALARLAKLAPVQSRIVDLRFFGGLPMTDVATALGISVRTVHREWVLAKAWLRDALEGP